MPPPTWEFAPAPHGHSGEQAGAASPGALSSPGSQGGGSPKQDGGGLSARSLKALSAQEQQAHLRVLEDEVRNKLWAMADFNGGEVRLLQRAFRKVDTSWPQGCVARADFVQALALVGVTVSRGEAALFFRKYGMDRDGLLPYEPFCRALLASPGRAPGADKLKEGPYRPGDHVNPDARVRYRPARKDAITVYPPADFDAPMARRSMELPDRGLKLDFVHGYGGLTNTAPNLFYTDVPGEIVYYTAAVGIVYDRRTHAQKFFRGHNDDIKCLAVHPEHRNVVCSGQVSPIGSAPYACIWDTHTARPVEGVPRLWHGRDDRGVIACCFSSGTAGGGDGGRRLVTCVADNEHSLYLWKWMSDTPQALCKLKNHQGTPPEVYGLMWHPHKRNAFLSWGCKHLKMWTPVTHGADGKSLPQHLRGKDWRAEKLHFKRVQPHNVLSVAVLPSGRIITGSPEGWLYVWEDGQLVGGPLKVHEPARPKKRAAEGAAPPPGKDAAHDALEPGRGNPVYTRPLPPGAAKGSKAAAAKRRAAPSEEPSKARDRRGVFCLKLRADGRTLLSAGADGRVLSWDVSNGDLRAGFSVRAEVRSPYDSKARPVFKSLDCHPDGGDVFIAGTRACDIWEIDNDPEVLIFGHTSDLYGCAFNPVVPTQYVTACDSSKVFLWDVKERWLQKVFEVGSAARAAAFSPDGAHLAVGLVDGRIKVIDVKRGEAAAPYMHFAVEQISVLKYSPDGAFLAVGSNDNFVDIYAVHNGYRRMSRCKGHSSFIKHLDWDAASRVVQCTSASYELLYFDAVTGQQAYEGLRDLTWTTWTCTLGFPVMGIFPPGADGTDINACSRSYTRGNRGGVLATADDFGRVKMFNYPCCIEDAPFHEYSGHSSHVTDVRFSTDDAYVVTTGGHDRAVFQWRVVDVPKPSLGPRKAAVSAVAIAARGEGDMSVADGERKPFSIGAQGGPGGGGGATSWQAQAAAALAAGRPAAGLCRYKVMVKTTDIRGASTSANVYLKLFGKGGSMKEARMLDAGRSCFERGNEDMFLFDAIDVGPMQKAVVHHDDTGFSPGWHLDSMTVTNSTTGERAHFVCEQWFDRTHGDRKIKRTLVAGGAGARGSVIEYRITVVTADVRSAGTSAGVSVLLEGDKGRSPEVPLESSKDDFMRGRTNVFRVRAADVGQLASLVVCNDMKGDSPEWCLKSIEVDSTGEGFSRAVFSCGQLWFDQAYPKRTLKPDGARGAGGAGTALGRPCDWVVTVVTADERFAGTDANVYLRIIGVKGETPTLRLEATRADFERGSVDIFNLRAPDVGEVGAIVIGHDGRGASAGWLCDSVEVVNATLGTRYFFLCGQWFDASSGDRLTERRLEVASAAAAKHAYSIRVLTSDERGAGTDADVFIEIEGDLAKSGRLKLDNSKNNFERAMLDEFLFTLPNLGGLTRLLLGHNNRGLGPGWKPEYVEVDDNNTGKTVFFPCGGQWWAKDEGDKQIERYLEPADAADPQHLYAVTIVTSDIKGAGTDADVTLSFMGSKGSSGEHRLDDSKNNFERGMVDSFQIKCQDVGVITSARIGHNNRGFGPSWHMQSMTITDQNTGVETVFACGMWFAKGEGDGEIVRTLVPSGAATAKVKYKIEVTTSDLRGAGTDAGVYMHLVGSDGRSGKLKIESSADDHERNSKCTVFKELPELGDITQIVLGHGNEGLAPGWHCESVVLTNGTTSQSWYFPVDMWFDQKQGDGQIERTIMSGSAQAAASGKATYKVTVYTADARGAGTDANVFVQLFGQAHDGSGEARTERITLDDSADNFERAAVDEFQFKERALNPITKIRLGMDGRGLGAAWKVSTVEVVNMATGNRFYFPVDDWFSKKDGLERELLPADAATVGKKHKYKVVVYTSDLRGAGTDANVFATIFGADKDSGRLTLDNSRDNFERNQVDTFFFEFPYSLGVLERVHIGHDNFGIGASWHCARVEVTELSTDQMVTFPASRWLSKSEGDKLIEVDLWPEGSTKAGMVQRLSSKYRIEVTTADERGAGTDANVFIELHGAEGLSSKREKLDTSKDDFERGRKDTFFVECSDLGKLDHIIIGTDGAGLGASWKLAYLEVINVQTNERSFFPCDAWFDKKHGLERTLKPDSPESMQGKRRLKVVVHTSDIRGAGTSANVSLVIFDAQGNRSAEHALDNSKDNFSRAQVDEFLLVDDGALVGEIARINIGHDGGGLGSGWHLQQVEITDVASGDTYFFPSGKWFDRSLEPKLLRQEITRGDPTAGVETGMANWKVVVNTSDKRGAGTDANVHIVLFSKDRQTAKQLLDTSKDNFERGAVDTFFFEDVDVGPVERIQIGHDNSLPFPGWHCQQVEVVNVTTGAMLTFPCDMWFDRRQGDKKIERVLFPRDATGAVVGVKTAKYRIEVHTADVRGAGTDANVSLMLSGEEGDTAEMRLTNNSGKDLFERGNTDEFLVEEKDVGALKKATVWHDGAWFGSDYVLRAIDVTNGATGDEFHFPAPEGDKGVLVKKNLRVELLAQGAESAVSTQPETRYKVTVKTSNKRGSGTDAHVFLRLTGQHGESGTIALPTARGDLERGQTNIYEIVAPTVGALEKLEIWHDNSGMFGAAWRLDWVEIEDLTTGVATKFRVYRWLDKKQGLKAEVYANGPGNVTPSSTPSATPMQTPRETSARPMAEVPERPATAPAASPMTGRPHAQRTLLLGGEGESERSNEAAAEAAGGDGDEGGSARGGGRRCKPCRSRRDVDHTSPEHAAGGSGGAAGDGDRGNGKAAASAAALAPVATPLATPTRPMQTAQAASAAMPATVRASAPASAAPAPAAAAPSTLPSLNPASQTVQAVHSVHALPAAPPTAAPAAVAPAPYDPRDPYAAPITAADAEAAADESARLTAALRREAQHRALADLEAREARAAAQQAALDERAAAFQEAMAQQREAMALQQAQLEQQQLVAAAALQETQAHAYRVQQQQQLAQAHRMQAPPEYGYGYGAQGSGAQAIAALDSFDPYASDIAPGGVAAQYQRGYI